MKTTFTKKQLSIAVASALALSFASGAVAQKMAPADERELWMENSRTMIWKNAYGECWHSYFGPPPPPNECAPAPVARKPRTLHLRASISQTPPRRMSATKNVRLPNSCCIGWP